MTGQYKTPQGMNVKIFRNTDSVALEKAINDWINTNDITVEASRQSESEFGITISVWYYPEDKE